MNFKRILIYSYLQLILSISCLVSPNLSIASTLDNWQNQQAYKPKPVLFLHGFGLGTPAGWAAAISGLNNWFSKYQSIGSYLETMDFQDPNGSVDTYGDGRAGWADKLKNKISDLLSSAKYGFYTNKLNIVSHSMGGLAAREYLTNAKYPAGYVDKLILIGTPNLGTLYANLASDLAKAQKSGWLIAIPNGITLSSSLNTLSIALDTILAIDINGEAAKDMTVDSAFLNSLNNRTQPVNVNYYGIYGITGTILNWYISGDYYGGDGVVSDTSQLGIGRINLQAAECISAFHTKEPDVSVSESNPLLKFLDSTKPELAITSHSPPPQVTEIHETSARIKGTVAKEYLPADTELTITGVNLDTGQSITQVKSLLKPSSLWIPNNSDSPVAEFDEAVTFPGNGTYLISCKAKNPAGIYSDTKTVYIKVVLPDTANIIIHCHNPEGKEIGSIESQSGNIGFSVELYAGRYASTFLGYSASDSSTHNKPITITAGTHTIKAVFNNMIKTQSIAINPGETKTVTFVFERITYDLTGLINTVSFNNIIEKTGTFTITDTSASFGASDSSSLPSSALEMWLVDISVSAHKGFGWQTNDSITVSYSAIAETKLNATTYYDKIYAKIQSSGDGSKYIASAVANEMRGTNVTAPADIPAQTFDKWFVQYIQNGCYPVISTQISAWFYCLIGNPDFSEPKTNCYVTEYIPALYGIESICVHADGASALDNRVAATESDGGPNSFIYSGSISNLKMSSVPYDFTGSAV